jgi:intergrase/recombinase
MWRHAREKTGINISCQDLRFWFSSEMGRLGVSDRYVDAFCGRVPRSILARHYTDYNPERLKEIYEKADIKILSN